MGEGRWTVSWELLMPAFGGLLRDPIGSTLYREIKSRWQEFFAYVDPFGPLMEPYGTHEFFCVKSILIT